VLEAGVHLRCTELPGVQREDVLVAESADRGCRAVAAADRGHQQQQGKPSSRVSQCHKTFWIIYSWNKIMK
jgi:hypothetical protein